MLNCIQRNLIKTLTTASSASVSPVRRPRLSSRGFGRLQRQSRWNILLSSPIPSQRAPSPPHIHAPPHTHARTHTFVEACFLPVGVSAYSRYPAGAVLPTLRDAVLTRAVCSGARGIEGAALRTLSNESRRLTMHKPTWLANCSNIRRVLPSLLCDTEV